MYAPVSVAQHESSVSQGKRTEMAFLFRHNLPPSFFRRVWTAKQTVLAACHHRVGRQAANVTCSAKAPEEPRSLSKRLLKKNK